MAKNDSAKRKPAEKFPLGHAKENKPASAYTGFSFFPADTKDPINKYTQPKQNPNSSDIAWKTDPNSLKANEITPRTPAARVSAGNITDGPKEDGITMRGYGAATKGIKSRGPMA